MKNEDWADCQDCGAPTRIRNLRDGLCIDCIKARYDALKAQLAHAQRDASDWHLAARAADEVRRNARS